MSRAVELNKAVIEVEAALNDLKGWRDAPSKSRASLQAISTKLNVANGRLSAIMHARFSG